MALLVSIHMHTKKETKRKLVEIAELALARMLGTLPRAARRNAARLYATEAYRHYAGLEPLNAMSPANLTVIDWISSEYKRHVTAMDAQARRGNDSGSPAGGPADRTPEVSIRVIAEDEA